MRMEEDAESQDKPALSEVRFWELCLLRIPSVRLADAVESMRAALIRCCVRVGGERLEKTPVHFFRHAWCAENSLIARAMSFA